MNVAISLISMKTLFRKINNFGWQEKNGVLEPDPNDPRDFMVGGILGWGNKYEPKHQELIIPTISIKNQFNRNTCTFESATAQKEIDEGVELSVRSVVIYAKLQGWIKSNGFSSLKLSQQAIQEFGAVEASRIVDDIPSWPIYSSKDRNSSQTWESAKEFRSDSYWKENSISELYESLDKFKAVQTAIAWYTGYNMGGGLDSPYILQKNKGRKVGYHAILVIGYKRNFHGQNVFVCQNSFGENWGDNGLFYIEESHLADFIDMFGGFLSMDIEKEVGKFLRDYNFKAVKHVDDPKIYLIANGQKRWFETMDAMQKSGFRSFHLVDMDELKKIPEGKSIK